MAMAAPVVMLGGAAALSAVVISARRYMFPPTSTPTSSAVTDESPTASSTVTNETSKSATADCGISDNVPLDPRKTTTASTSKATGWGRLFRHLLPRFLRSASPPADNGTGDDNGEDNDDGDDHDGMDDGDCNSTVSYDDVDEYDYDGDSDAASIGLGISLLGGGELRLRAPHLTAITSAPQALSHLQPPASQAQGTPSKSKSKAGGKGVKGRTRNSNKARSRRSLAPAAADAVRLSGPSAAGAGATGAGVVGPGGVVLVGDDADGGDLWTDALQWLDLDGRASALSCARSASSAGVGRLTYGHKKTGRRSLAGRTSLSRRRSSAASSSAAAAAAAATAAANGVHIDGEMKYGGLPPTSTSSSMLAQGDGNGAGADTDAGFLGSSCTPLSVPKYRRVTSDLATLFFGLMELYAGDSNSAGAGAGANACHSGAYCSRPSPSLPGSATKPQRLSLVPSAPLCRRPWWLWAPRAPAADLAGDWAACFERPPGGAARLRPMLLRRRLRMLRLRRLRRLRLQLRRPRRLLWLRCVPLRSQSLQLRPSCAEAATLASG